MTKTRLEAFSDGVIAILITIMVLELKVPHGDTFDALKGLWPVFLSYVLSFLYLGIYWNNHHHLLQAVRHVRGGTLWANMHLLFWLSLIPFTTAWMGENHFSKGPVILYGLVLIFCACAYSILVRVLVSHHGAESELARAIGNDSKGYLSLALYAAAIPLALLQPLVACAIYVLVAIIWLVPDRRIERVLIEAREEHRHS